MPTEVLEKSLLFAQDQFIFSQAKFPAIVGTWGCGKSLAGLYAANIECESHPNNLYLVIRKEFVDLRDSTMQDWSNEIGRPWDGDKNVNYENGSVLMFRHGKDIDSLKNTNLGGCLIIQAEEMTEEEFWFICGRLRRKQGSLQLRCEANYNGHNWLYKLWKKRDINVQHGSTITEKDFHLIETCTLDNKENLPASYIASLEMLPEKLKRRHFYGSWDEAQGLVFDEFSENKHCIEPISIPEGWEKGFVLDHGFTNPTAALWYAIDWDGNLYLYDEHYEREKPPSYHAEQILKRHLTSGMCDPSIFSKTQSRGLNSEIFSIADEYRDFGVSLYPAIRGSDASGIARVNEFFKAGKIRVFNTLTNFIQEINNWKYRTSKAHIMSNAPEEPEDKDNHLMDCIKYVIVSRFGKSQLPTLKTPDGSVAKILEKLKEDATAVGHKYEGQRYAA
jgi:phage terminase large subunit